LEQFHLLYALADALVSFSALTLLVGRQEGHPAGKKYGGWWRWALVSPDGVAPSRMIGVSSSVNLPLHHEVQKFSYGTVSHGWYRKKGRKTVVVVWWYALADDNCVGNTAEENSSIFSKTCYLVFEKMLEFSSMVLPTQSLHFKS